MSKSDKQSSKINSTSKSRRSGGCLYLVMVTIAAGTLIVFNTAIVDALLSHYTHESSPLYSFLSNDKIRQTLLFVLPVAMVLMEYWVYDLLVDRSNSLEETEERIREVLGDTDS